MTHDATLERHEDDLGHIYCVVTQAAPTIWITPELLAEAAKPGKAEFEGGLERDGDLVSFGTPGRGLGRLTYRLTEYDARHNVHWAVRSDDAGLAS